MKLELTVEFLKLLTFFVFTVMFCFVLWLYNFPVSIGLVSGFILVTLTILKIFGIIKNKGTMK